MLSQAQRSVTSSLSNRLSQMPSLQNLCGVVSTSFTHQHLHVVNYNRGSASGRGPTGGDYYRIRDSRKNDRDRSTLITGNSLRVQIFQAVDSRQNLSANQSN